MLHEAISIYFYVSTSRAASESHQRKIASDWSSEYMQDPLVFFPLFFFSSPFGCLESVPRSGHPKQSLLRPLYLSAPPPRANSKHVDRLLSDSEPAPDLLHSIPTYIPSLHYYVIGQSVRCIGSGPTRTDAEEVHPTTSSA